MKNILILGSSGLLGSELSSGPYLKKFNTITQSLNSDTDIKLDLGDYNKVRKMIQTTKPFCIINLVGITDVDHCEKFPKDAFKVNIQTINNIVNAIKVSSIQPHLIHISTDQVYDNKGFCAEENISLSNYYSFSKYVGELLASQINSTILRTNFFGKSKVYLRKSLTDWIYNNLMNKNSIKVFEDVWFNPLSIYTLCKMILLTVQRRHKGVFNLGSKDAMNKAEFAIYFAKILGFPTSDIKKIKVDNADFLNAYRPKGMIMKTTKFEAIYKIKLPNLKKEIKSVAQEYLK